MAQSDATLRQACENWQLRALYSHDLEPPDTSGIAEGLTIGVDSAALIFVYRSALAIS